MTSNSGNSTYGTFYVNSSRLLTATGTGSLISAVNLGLSNVGTLNLYTPSGSDTLTVSTALVKTEDEVCVLRVAANDNAELAVGSMHPDIAPFDSALPVDVAPADAAGTDGVGGTQR